MRNDVLVKRYAEGYLRFAQERIGFDPAVQEFQKLKMLLRQHPQLEDFLLNRDISLLEKDEYIKNVLAQLLSQPMQKLLGLLIEKGRIDLIIDIADYVRVTYVKGEAVEAVLKTTFPLDTDLITAIKERLERHWGQHFKLYIQMEPQLLGGVQITVGNQIIDGSIRNRLEDLRKKLKAVRVD